jgi:hypothetical protein
VYPDQVVGTDQWRQGGGEQVVDPAVAVEFRPLETAEADLVVQHRPQRAVGEAAVEFVVVLPGQVDGEQGDRPDGAFGLGLAGFGDLPAPAEPQAAFLLQRVQHAGRQATGGCLAFLDGGDAVGNDDETRHGWRCFPGALA